jgi:hypothetical protein
MARSWARRLRANRPGGFSLLEMMMVVVSSKLPALSRQLSASLLIYGQPYPRFPSRASLLTRG